MSLLQVVKKSVLSSTSQQVAKRLSCSREIPHSRYTRKCSFGQIGFRKMSHTSTKYQGRVRFQSSGSSISSGPSKIPVSSSISFQSSYSETDVDPTDPLQLAKEIFFQGLQNVLPSKLILSQVKLQGSLLKLENEENTTVDLSQYNKKYVVGFGKACLPMAESLLLTLNGLIDRCIVSVPVGTRKCKNNSIEVYCGAKDNIPDEDSLKASKAILELVRNCTKNDLLIVLISGGGSALLPFPIPPILLEEKKEFIKKLSKAGCTIHELNTIRKRISLVKGGGLVEMCNAGKIISLIISDVAGSPMDIISSGPTVENEDNSQAALNIIKKYNLEDSMPETIKQVLSRPPPRGKKENFANVTNFIIGDNKIALDTAASAAAKYKLHPFIITTEMSGEAAQVGYDMANIAEAFAFFINHELPNHDGQIDDSDIIVKSHLETIKNTFKKYKWSTAGILPEIFDEHNKASKGICLLFGGETTVTVQGRGKGGRNQELALSSGIRLDLSRNLPHVKGHVSILSAGTDGLDGPNTAAGAVIEGPTIHNAQLQGFSPLTYLKNNDSFNFFHNVAQGKYHIVCGHTETNVMDLVIIVILKKSGKKGDHKKKSML